jgi:FkbH-like protein
LQGLERKAAPDTVQDQVLDLRTVDADRGRSLPGWALSQSSTQPYAFEPGGREGGFAPDLRAKLAKAIAAHGSSILGWWSASQFDEDRLRRFNVRLDGERPAELKSRYLAPLLQILVAYARTGEARYRDVYLDERLRFAPHHSAADVRIAFFQEMLRSDERAVLNAVGADREVRDAAMGLLTALHQPLVEPDPGAPLRILALGDCLMNEVRVSVNGSCRAAGIPLDFRMLYFSAYMGRALSPEDALGLLREFPADLVALSFLSYKGIAPYVALLRDAPSLSAAKVDRRVEDIAGIMRDFLGCLREHTDAPFVVHNASGLPLQKVRSLLHVLPAMGPSHRLVIGRLNAAIAELVQHTPKTILLDEAAVATARGLRNCAEPLIPRSVVSGAFFHTTRFAEYLAEPHLDIARSFRELSKAKAMLIDFDNTLWKGVMADGPVEQRHQLQRLLKQAKDAGILLIAISKNDPKNIRWDEMTLQPSDFVLQKINWNLKAQSVREAADQLNLGLDSFVLVDDNPVERDLVTSQLPKVRALDALDPKLEAWIGRMLRFPNTRQTEEARSRTELYRQQAARREVLQEKFDYPAMMASLGLEVEFGRAQPKDFDRIFELIERTNQFNTTTIRYGRQQLRSILASPEHAVYVAHLADKFGSVGLVCVVIVRREGTVRILQSFVMSCRAMGFELERLMLSVVLDAELMDGVAAVGRFVPTDRNTPAKSLFAANGFEPRGVDEWVLEPGARLPERPAWFKLKSR